ncbi:MAG: MGMT family protein [Gammaproteobacteria bacterium]|nr:MGMT family protein [Gammaproteobacteria bacterium]
MRQIPYGKVSTYGQIAKLLPRPQEISAQDYKSSGPRWVGLALAACPDDVPWHRVINSQGKISHNAEPGRQRKLLELEGLVFSFQKLDLNIHQWHGPGHRDQPEQGNLF